MRPFRFGIVCFAAGSREEWVSKARKAEELGYSAFLVPDHLLESLAPLPALAIAAEATSRIRLGTLVLNNDLRHPVLLAREAAALDLLSGGRLEPGIGAGHAWPEYEQIGLRFDAPKTRIERLAESVTILKGLLRGDEVSFSARTTKWHAIGSFQGLNKNRTSRSSSEAT
jgi:probable F420-dependent oxidoreductase